jgi:hypothetical protein
MRRSNTPTIPLIAAITAVLTLAACGSQTVDPTPTSATGADPTMTSTSGYPKTGHAPDYSWIAGRVTFTKIQGGCIYIYTDPADIQDYEASLTPPPGGIPTISGPFVSTAVSGDTSIPLRDMTPATGSPPTQPPTSKFVPLGPGWNPSQHKDGDYIVLTGRLAGPDDPKEICPGGTHYVADAVLPNP